MMKFRFRRQGADPQREKLKQELFAFNKVRRERRWLGQRAGGGGPGARAGARGPEPRRARGEGAPSWGAARGPGRAPLGGPHFLPSPLLHSRTLGGSRSLADFPSQLRVPVGLTGSGLRVSVYLGLCVSLSLCDSVHVSGSLPLSLPVITSLSSACACVSGERGVSASVPVCLCVSLLCLPSSVSSSLSLCLSLPACLSTYMCLSAVFGTLTLALSLCLFISLPLGALGAPAQPLGQPRASVCFAFAPRPVGRDEEWRQMLGGGAGKSLPCSFPPLPQGPRLCLAGL